MVIYVERHRNAPVDTARCWAVSDGRAGNARQAEALAAAIAIHLANDGAIDDAGNDTGERAIDTHLLSPRAPWRWAAPRRLPCAHAAFGAAFTTALASPPSLVVGCGRQAALATRLLGDRGARTVQILDPRIAPSHWDLVVVPEHDALRGDNVITALGSLHPVDDGWLARARDAFPSFAALPRPRTALLLGGSSRHAQFDAAAFAALADQLDGALARDGGSVLATTSRRSPEAVRHALAQRYGHAPHRAWRGPEDGDNPYPGLLAWADRIVCSPDSVNMVTEACATRVPVFVFAPQRVEGGPRRFLDALLARGRIRAMDDALAAFDAEPLRETARVARLVSERLALR